MPALGEILENERKADFKELLKYYQSLTINSKCFEKDYVELLDDIHKFAVAIDILSRRIENIPEDIRPYLLQLKSDVVQVLSLTIIGNERGVNLLERSMIENAFIYIYYYHHEIEHQILMKDPGKYKSFSFLKNYLKEHPFFVDIQTIAESIGALDGKYSELSKVIHAGVINEASIKDSIDSLHKPLSEIKKQKKNFEVIGQNLIFLLMWFNNKELSLTADEYHLATLSLTGAQKKQLSKLV